MCLAFEPSTLDPALNPAVDGATMVSHLFAGLKWYDGEARTAKDFDFSWKCAASVDLGADYGSIFEVVKGYEEGDQALTATSDTILEVILNNQRRVLERAAGFPDLFPGPRERCGQRA